MYKDILALVDSSRAEVATLAAATEIARRFDAHLSALHVEPLPFVPVDAMTGYYPRALIEYQEKVSEERSAAVGKAIAEAEQKTGVQIERRMVTGDVESVATLHARHADLVVVGLDRTQAQPNQTESFWEAVAIDGGRPVLAIPADWRGVAGQRVLIAWRPTAESARAVNDALPILRTAKSVRLLTLNPTWAIEPRDPGADIARHLARHDIGVDVVSREVEDSAVGATILQEARAFGADLIVAGAYGHARVREYVLGGTTLHLVRNSSVPLLMTH